MKRNNDREYVIGLADIYQNHAKPWTIEILDKEKKPELIEEIDRKARFLEEMMTELSKKTKMNMKANKESIHQRTDENRKLIAELNDVRQKQQANLKEISKCDKEIQELELKNKQLEKAPEEAPMANKMHQGSEASMQ